VKIGGPAFLEAGGVLFVAGVSSWQNNSDQGGQEGVYGVWEFSTRVSSYADWIGRAIEEGKK